MKCSCWKKDAACNVHSLSNKNIDKEQRTGRLVTFLFISSHSLTLSL